MSETLDEVHTIQSEVEDRYGKMSEDIEVIFSVGRLKVLMKQHRMALLVQIEEQLFEFRFSSFDERRARYLEVAKRNRPDLFYISANYSLFLNIESIGINTSVVEKIVHGLEMLSSF